MSITQYFGSNRRPLRWHLPSNRDFCVCLAALAFPVIVGCRSAPKRSIPSPIARLSAAQSQPAAFAAEPSKSTPRQFDSPREFDLGRSNLRESEQHELDARNAASSLIRPVAFTAQSDLALEEPPGTRPAGVASTSSPSDRDPNALSPKQQSGPVVEAASIVKTPDPMQADAKLTDEEVEDLQLREFISRAISFNPRIASLRQHIASLQHRVPQARALADPVLQETFWPFNGNALETAGGRAANQLSLSQQIPWPAKLDAKAAIACRDIQIAQAELENLRLEITEQVTQAYIEIWLADQALVVTEEFGELVGDLNRVSEAKYLTNNNQSGQLDLLRAKMEGDLLEDRQARWVEQKALATAELAALLHAPFDSIESNPELNIPQNYEEQLAVLVGIASTCNPELRSVTLQIAKEQEKKNLACLQQYPDFQVGANWLIVSDRNALSPVATGNDNFGLSFGMTVPIWREKIQAGISEASHAKQAAQLNYSSTRDQIVLELRRKIARLSATREQLEILTRRIIPRTEDALKLSLASYRVNRTEFTAVIELYKERLALEIQALSHKAEIAKVIAGIERTIGASY